MLLLKFSRLPNQVTLYVKDVLVVTHSDANLNRTTFVIVSEPVEDAQDSPVAMETETPAPHVSQAGAAYSEFSASS